MNQKTANQIALVRVVIFFALGLITLFSDIFQSLPGWQRYGLAALMFGYAAFRGLMYWRMRKNDE